MTEHEGSILALALGRLLLQYEKTLDKQALAVQARCGAEKCLLDIADILDRKDLTDFQCVDEIITCMEKIGLNTWRHDFG